MFAVAQPAWNPHLCHFAFAHTQKGLLHSDNILMIAQTSWEYSAADGIRCETNPFFALPDIPQPFVARVFHVDRVKRAWICFAVSKSDCAKVDRARVPKRKGLQMERHPRVDPAPC